jgi:hypothetical protein
MICKENCTNNENITLELIWKLLSHPILPNTVKQKYMVVHYRAEMEVTSL